MPPTHDRRQALRLLGAGLVVGVGAPWLTSCTGDAAPADPRVGRDPAPPPAPDSVGPLRPPDAHGLRLPAGFSSRLVAVSGLFVAGTDHRWHTNPDGGACFATDGGGWAYVSNCEDEETGGVGVLRFDAAGSIVSAARLLDGTRRNCAGGATPWGTWLSCEEVPDGQVFEVDPTGRIPPRSHPAMGLFKHEAACVVAADRAVILSEDEPDGALYRFAPSSWPDLSAGELSVLAGERGERRWAPVPDPAGASEPTRHQVDDIVRFDGGEGLAHHDGVAYLATKGDDRIWAVTGTEVEVVYDAATTGSLEGDDPILTGVDNICVDLGGDRYVAEENGTMDVVRLGDDALVEPVVRLVGVEGSEITGPSFSPDGTRLYFSSQRNPGATYEVTGPFPHART